MPEKDRCWSISGCGSVAINTPYSSFTWAPWIAKGWAVSCQRSEEEKMPCTLAADLRMTNAAASKWRRGKGFPDVSLPWPVGASFQMSPLPNFFMAARGRSMELACMRALFSDLAVAAPHEIARGRPILRGTLEAPVAVSCPPVMLMTRVWENSMATQTGSAPLPQYYNRVSAKGP